MCSVIRSWFRCSWTAVKAVGTILTRDTGAAAGAIEDEPDSSRHATTSSASRSDMMGRERGDGWERTVKGKEVLLRARPGCGSIVGHATPVDGRRIVAENRADALEQAVELLVRLPRAQAEQTIGPNVWVNDRREHRSKGR